MLDLGVLSTDLVQIDVQLSPGNVLNLFPDGDQRVAVPVQLALVLALRRLDHQTVVQGPGMAAGMMGHGPEKFGHILGAGEGSD